MVTYKVTCKGIKPLLMNPATDELLEELRTGVRRGRVKDRTVHQEAEGKIYRNEKGEIGIPAINLFSCLVEGGREIPFTGKKKISTVKSTVLPMFFTIVDDFFPITPSDWVPDKRKGTNPKDGTAVAVVRPKFPQWGFAVTVEIDEKVISVER